MRSKPSVKPSAYPPLPFHAIRFFGFLSSIVVGAILAVFIYHLHADGYKLPYSFLVLLVAAALSLLNILLTTLIHCSCGLSPKLSITANIILLILWAISFGLVCWSLSGTITTSCTTTHWGNSTGISVCRSYKALFTFTIIALVAHISALWLDIIVRRRQNRFGTYGAMGSQPGLDDAGAFDVKMDDHYAHNLGHGHQRGGSEATPALQDFDNLPPANSSATMHGAQGYGHGYEYEAHGEVAHAGDAQGYYGYDAGGMSHRGRQGYQDPYQREYTGYDPAAYR
ncbi:hypothetical protein N7499_011794 [Penicillium canescens]|uniref:MARVEL domain-containing protein n=1 Tax=Penicillium canescens TaxID=5083 RepID=A0AAD6IKV4_PENCN|nr:uncharacterized protein N7446_007056 [Penicillium canescens]KAJ6012536.1 hypothetical protein N7522_002891 [Penicillium canescens]KAJ6049619.1 hypothetical protein N7444_006335 [Penicillium canescens]KAJ6052413.1 hypothetical protein N7460_002947 [Penicillium canescens]KAJ6062936.1 hypothetical protein N7446_007056 [Penicillium canescens]KAJ6069907.1 hypothetical protein N7499_011794 [Penicillium canescens]